MFDNPKLSFNMVLKYNIGVKYQYACRALCAYAYDFQNQQMCALIGACALIRTNTVYMCTCI